MSYRISSRVSAGILAFLMLSMTACGVSEKETESTETDPVESVETESSTEETRTPHNLPDKNFDGASYRISYYCYGNEDKYLTLQPNETNGDTVNDAVFNRNSVLMDTYNFVFDTTPYTSGTYDDQNKMISSMILADEDLYEIIYGHCVGTCNAAVLGHYMNLYDIPHLNFSAEWWPAQSVAEMTVYDRMYTICGSATYDQLAAAKVVYFNKDLAEQYNLPDMYEMVRKGEWTMDALIAQTAGIYEDVNGDGEKDEGDVYGYTSIAVQNGFFISTNTPVLAMTEDGGREISIMNERAINLIEKLYGWYYESGNVFLTPTDSSGKVYYTKMFASGNAAMAFGKLCDASDIYRESDISYGILPQPKYDTAQENYYAFACPSLFSVPITCRNTELAGFVLEAMTYYGYYDIAPAYYEITLQGKIADAPQDAEMLKIINDSLTVSFAYCYDNWKGFAHFLSAIFNEKSGKKDISSYFETRKKSADKRLETCLAAFRADESDT